MKQDHAAQDVTFRVIQERLQFATNEAEKYKIFAHEKITQECWIKTCSVDWNKIPGKIILPLNSATFTMFFMYLSGMFHSVWKANDLTFQSYQNFVQIFFEMLHKNLKWKMFSKVEKKKKNLKNSWNSWGNKMNHSQRKLILWSHVQSAKNDLNQPVKESHPN